MVASHIDDIHGYLAQHEQKQLLRFVAVGSVDDGKSTLIGRLLYDTKGIYDDQLAAVESASQKRGSAGGKLDLSLLTDGLRAEREQGITIDVAYRYFSTDKRKFIIADTPGHVQYTRNMATGASTATVALILIDARHGVLQQSRRHAHIASLLGIPHLAVCVNKMDLVGFDRSVYDAICADFQSFAASQRFDAVTFLPVSATEGDNVVSKSARTPWFDGLPLLAFLESVPLGTDINHDAFRFPVQYVLRPDLTYRGYCGQIASGVVSKGDQVMVLPSGRHTRVAAIDSYEDELGEAYAPMSVTLRLEDEVDVSRGDMIVHRDDAPIVTRRFEAQVVWMSDAPLDKTKSYLLKHTTRVVRAHVDTIVGRLDLERLEEVASAELGLNDIGRIELSCNQPIYAEAYVTNRQLGAFVLIDALSNNTVGAGMIVRPLEERDDGGADASHTSVDAAERRARLGHGACVLWFDGEPTSEQPAFAFALERALFEVGVVATVIDVAALSDGTRSPLLFADLARQCVDAGLVVILSTGLSRVAERTELSAKLGEHMLTIAADENAMDVVDRLRKRGSLPTTPSAGG